MKKITTLSNAAGINKVAAKGDKMMTENDFFNDAAITAKVEKISLSELSKKTTGRKQFWKKEAKEKFKTDKIARTKLRNEQTDKSNTVIKYYKMRLQNECNEAINALFQFYTENCNHENFSILSCKNAETGKNIESIKSAIQILRKAKNIK